MFPYFEHLAPHLDKVALQDATNSPTYRQLIARAHAAKACLLHHANASHLQGQRVAFQAVTSADYVATLWGIWLAGGLAVPVSLSYPHPEMVYVLENAQASFWITQDTQLHALAGKSCLPLTYGELLDFPTQNEENAADRSDFLALPALMIYTSGTTGKPKGAVLAHENLLSQIRTLVQAWAWTSDDKTLHALPLHHIHGIVNVLLCGLYVGANLEFSPKFEAGETWQRFAQRDYTLFMAVPTLYNRLIEHWRQCPTDLQQTYSHAVGKMRLMVSGSAALPTPTLEQWRVISGHFLLERYGMTEIGMALSNPLQGVRKAGSVGKPLTGVEVRLADENGLVEGADVAGEIQVRSKNIFVGYWQKNEATAESFTQDGWFKTGDIARRDEEGYYYILGRNSVDILKTGGYKVSALEIEEVLLQHPAIRECAVVGIPDADWGERVVAVLVVRAPITLPELRTWAKQHLAPYKIPQDIKIVDALPRNAMGKVVKKQLV